MIETARPRLFYGWIVVAASFVVCFSFGLLHTFGVFFTPLLEEFGWSRGLTSSVFSFQYGAMALSFLVMGQLIDKLGSRFVIALGGVLLGLGLSLSSLVQEVWQLYLLYSITGFGLGTAWVTPAAAVQRWFLKRRGLVLGIVIAGVGIGGLVMAPGINYLIAAFSWRVAYVVVGISLWFLMTCAALLMVDSPEKKGLKPYGAEDYQDLATRTSPQAWEGWSLWEVLRSKVFIAVLAIYSLGPFAWTILMVHIVPFALDIEIEPVAAASAVGLIAGVSTLGRLGSGVLADKIGWKGATLITAGICALMTLWLIATRSLWMLYLFVLIYGLAHGGLLTSITGLLGHLFGTRALARLTGITWGLGGLFALLGPLIAGFLFDRMQSYFLSFLIAALFFALSAVLALVLKPLAQPQERALKKPTLLAH